jgi:hypothetical protein
MKRPTTAMPNHGSRWIMLWQDDDTGFWGWAASREGKVHAGPCDYSQAEDAALASIRWFDEGKNGGG